MEIAPSSPSLTCGHVIGCFGVWYQSDREGGTDVHACFGPDLHSRRDGRSCYMSCRRIFAVSWHEYREDARYRRSSKVLSSASRFRHVVNINTASITKRAMMIGGCHVELKRSSISIREKVSSGKCLSWLLERNYVIEIMR